MTESAGGAPSSCTMPRTWPMASSGRTTYGVACCARRGVAASASPFCALSPALSPPPRSHATRPNTVTPNVKSAAAARRRARYRMFRNAAKREQPSVTSDACAGVEFEMVLGFRFRTPRRVRAPHSRGQGARHPRCRALRYGDPRKAAVVLRRRLVRAFSCRFPVPDSRFPIWR